MSNFRQLGEYWLTNY